MEIDYVRVYQNALVDTTAPINFTATVGSVTSSTIELLLNATDNSGTIAYTITYGSNTISLANPSGVQKSVIVPNLLPNTSYSFTVTASDLAGNSSVDNPILVNATTTSVIGCSGTDADAQEGTFAVGYNYAFETLGTDVKITFQLLDTDKVGVVAFLRQQTPFTEAQMTNVSGNTFTKTISGQTVGATISYAVKFAYAGGLSVTKYFSYVVGNNCALEVATYAELDQFTFLNPADDFLTIETKISLDKVEIYNMVGNLVLSTSEGFAKIDVKKLSKGIYLLAVYSGNKRSVKKLIVK
jgi:hypothetical protein